MTRPRTQSPEPSWPFAIFVAFIVLYVLGADLRG